MSEMWGVKAKTTPSRSGKLLLNVSELSVYLILHWLKNHFTFTIVFSVCFVLFSLKDQNLVKLKMESECVDQ